MFTGKSVPQSLLPGFGNRCFGGFTLQNINIDPENKHVLAESDLQIPICLAGSMLIWGITETLQISGVFSHQYLTQLPSSQGIAMMQDEIFRGLIQQCHRGLRQDAAMITSNRGGNSRNSPFKNYGRLWAAIGQKS